LILASRLMAQGRGDGLYFALPTMATANAMYERLAAAYRRLFSGDDVPSLVLAHSARALHEDFSGAKLPDDALDDAPGDDESVAAACARWIRDDRRRTFFADVGVGTIDQAFLSVLPSRFQGLRLNGLSGKVLIVDEAHAYDAYMGAELERLLEFHARLGGSAIVASATLPQKTRRTLIEAFAGTVDATGRPGAYPALSLAGQAGACIHAVQPAAIKRVGVQRLETMAEATALIKASAGRGAACAWVRNSVDDAIAGVEALRAEGVPATLFHARFAMADRMEREGDVLSTFGKDARAEARRGRVLVATQVIEQSLDLDFDVMVSDLAPVDLLIQRAGRLFRHERENRPVAEAILHVLSPAPVSDADAGWLPAELRGTRFVYANHGVLWRSMAALEKVGTIHAPETLRTLIEAVYGEDCGEPPPGLKDSESQARGKALGDTARAQQKLLCFKDGYVWDGTPWEADEDALTRLEEVASVTVRLGTVRGGEVVPWARAEPAWRAWALSELRVRADWLEGAEPAGDVAEAVAAAEAAWPKRQRTIPLLVVRSDGSLALHGGSVPLAYTQMGLVRLQD
jgi:CRISPR-associated endonuclease/helicase Cas3